MSNQQHVTAKIPGLKGPFFPKRLEIVQPLYSLWAFRNYNALRLAAAVETLHPRAPVSTRFSFKMVRLPHEEKTSDEYIWKAAIDYKIIRRGFHFGSLTMLLPHCNDADLVDGTYTDRSIAIHMSDNVGDDCLEQFVRLFHDGFETVTQSMAA